MENLSFHLAQIGPVLALGLGLCGSAIGCYAAGMASHAAMAREEGGGGKFIAMAATPSSQAIYGFGLMLLMSQKIQAGTLSPIASIAIGLFAGLGIFASAVFQGRVAAAGIQATLKQPSVYGKCFAAIGILESFALFAFVLPLMIM